MKLLQLGKASGFNQPGMEEWLATRPECVQLLAREFPPMTEVEIDGRVHYVFGWTEDDSLILSHFNPDIQYDHAMESHIHLCAEHLRKR